MTDDRLRFDGVENYLTLQLEDDAPLIQFATPLVQDGSIPVGDFTDTQYLTLSILDANYRLREIVYLTGYRAGETSGSIQRGQEGTIAQTHPVGSKIVHAPTVEDFLRVQDHDADPHAHEAEITSICNGLISSAIATHNMESSNPHPYFVKKSDAVFTGPVTFTDTSVVSVYGILRIEEGATLIVDGDIQVNGRIFINGRQLIISNTQPASPATNVVWIQTFG
jgi:hypothetical protein